MSTTADPLPPRYEPPPVDGAASAPPAAPPGGPTATPDGRAAEPPSDPDEAPTADVALHVPRDTTPTWELELLVSGAVLFGLFQVVGLIDGFVLGWKPHVGIIGMFAVLGVGLLGTAALYGLIACFVAHLALRAYWVALVGANSVFPRGVRWDRMKQYGPLQTELLRTRVQPLPRYIAWADNAASVLFATGFVFAASTATGIVVLAPAGVVLWALEGALGLKAALVALALLAAPLAILQIGAALLDYKLKGRLDGSRGLGRLVMLGMRAAYATSPASIRSLSSVLSTNISPKVVFVGMAVGTAIFIGVASERLDDAGGLSNAGNYTYFSDGGLGAVEAARYGTLRGDLPAPDRTPSLDSDVATGPYLRLFVPYRPLVHGAAIPATCPGVRPLDFDDDVDREGPAVRAATEAVLRCAERLHAVTLDGRPLASLRFRFFADPKTNRRGFLAYLPTAGLAAGEHLITVRPVRRPGDDRAPPVPYLLPFWR